MSRAHFILAFALLCSTYSPEALASRLNVLTLNLHGYHPMGYEERKFESRSGSIRRANSFLTYFPVDEIRDGHEKQLRYLAKEISGLPEADQPHVILLQEVGAGLPTSQKDCAEFYANPAQDVFGKNTSLRLQHHFQLQGQTYDAALACRGNIGWQTDANTFSQERILTASGKVVFDFNSNPYPAGFIVEGTALLVRKPYVLLDQRVERLVLPGTNETAFIQFARIQKAGERGWILVANLHGNHKVRHFEGALAARERFEQFVATHPDRANFKGAIVGGDFNANLYRPKKGSRELSTLPWEVSVAGEFDFKSALDRDFDSLDETLWKQNIDSGFKGWASVGSDANARTRVSSAVSRFKSFARSSFAIDLEESFSKLDRKSCLSFPTLDSACTRGDRIDLVYSSSALKPVGTAVIFAKNNYYSLQGPTDHPGIYVHYED